MADCSVAALALELLAVTLLLGGMMESITPPSNWHATANGA